MASTFHRSVDWVREQLWLLEMPMDVQGLVHERYLSVGAGRQLAKITDNEYRAFLCKTAVENGVTERTAAAWVAAWKAMVPADAAAGLTVNPAGALPVRLAPQGLCMGCHETFPPDGMVPVYVCPACVAVLRERGLAGRARP